MVANIAVQNFLPNTADTGTHKEIINGLMAHRKYIPPKYFYNTTGSELFEEITRLDEYYPTRTEKQILSGLLDMIRIRLRDLNIIELGSGDPSKIALLLQQIPDALLRTINYYPVDICESEIIKSVDILADSFPLHSISGIVADFHHQLHLLPKDGNRLFCFFGSTLGNFTTEESERFIRRLAEAMNPGDRLLLGVDMVKDTEILERAYNDSKGVTEQFNLNILNVLNDIIGTDFRTDDFEHLAFFNKDENRIEMHLKAVKDMEIYIRDYKITVRLRKNETIHTENSHKFTYDKICKLCRWGSFKRYSVCHDPQGWFSVVYAVK